MGEASAWARELSGVLYLLAPLAGGALASGLCIRFGWLSALARPIDGGRHFRGRSLFGPNKTFRGVLAVAVGNMTVLGAQTTLLHGVPWSRGIELFDYGAVDGWLLGLLLGLLAALAELLNSFAKRQAGIGPGEAGRGAVGALFRLLDQVDVLLGVWLAYAWVVPVSPGRVLLSAVVLALGHQAITLVGKALGMRRTTIAPARPGRV